MEALKCSGLVGLGGAGFPAHVKFNLKDINAVDTLVVNAAECEPYITTDLRTMLDKSDMLLKGIKAVQQFMPIKHVYIGIEDNKPQAIEKLRKEYANESSIEVVPLKAMYPKGAEKVIAYETAGQGYQGRAAAVAGRCHYQQRHLNGLYWRVFDYRHAADYQDHHGGWLCDQRA